MHHNELLVTTYWDSHYSMLCSTKETSEAVRASSHLEGFYSMMKRIFIGV
ncbi:hypothetical protein [Virgibacillus pantothenticus]|nr:hypothetical protein [Virgibacillus pantothenticus]